MEYPELIEIKRKLIIDFVKYRRHWDDDLDYVPYSYSYESLKDTLKGIDDVYEYSYEDCCNEKPQKSDDRIDRIKLINAFANSNISVSDIAFILGYSREEVEDIYGCLKTNKRTT